LDFGQVRDVDAAIAIAPCKLSPGDVEGLLQATAPTVNVENNDRFALASTNDVVPPNVLRVIRI
jgi:hypothetical protein